VLALEVIWGMNGCGVDRVLSCFVRILLLVWCFVSFTVSMVFCEDFPVRCQDF
jgi:uncharacterized membrane protein